VILAMAALAERLAALTFKVKGTIEKDQLTSLNGRADNQKAFLQQVFGAVLRAVVTARQVAGVRPKRLSLDESDANSSPLASGIRHR
jgi:hypothetical protein